MVAQKLGRGLAVLQRDHPFPERHGPVRFISGHSHEYQPQVVCLGLLHPAVREQNAYLRTQSAGGEEQAVRPLRVLLDAHRG